MARARDSGERAVARGWFGTLLGMILLIGTGFVLGLLAGIVTEEPELVAGHVVGRSTGIEWTADEQTERVSDEDFVARDDDVIDSLADPAAYTAAEAPLAGVAAGPPDLDLSSHDQAFFMIQVGAFSDATGAQRTAAQVRARGYPVMILSPEQDDRWRVRVGPLEGRAAAEAASHRLKEEDQLPTWILRDGES